MKDSEVWGFEWDDPDKAAKEVEREVFGKETDSGTKFCFECGEVAETVAGEKPANCSFCGQNYDLSEESKRALARIIDVVYPIWNGDQRKEFHRMVKRLRLVSPEFRAMWEHETNTAALLRRYA